MNSPRSMAEFSARSWSICFSSLFEPNSSALSLDFAAANLSRKTFHSASVLGVSLFINFKLPACPNRAGDFYQMPGSSSCIICQNQLFAACVFPAPWPCNPPALVEEIAKAAADTSQQASVVTRFILFTFSLLSRSRGQVIERVAGACSAPDGF